MNHSGPILLTTLSPEETLSVGVVLGRHLGPGDVVGLTGDLGSGKTTMTRGVAQGLGIHHGVTSPSFALLHIYAGPLPLHHIDFYRLSTPQQLLDMDYDLLFPEAACSVIEWADRFSDVLPPMAAEIDLTHAGESRREIRLLLLGEGLRSARHTLCEKWGEKV